MLAILVASVFACRQLATIHVAADRALAWTPSGQLLMTSKGKIIVWPEEKTTDLKVPSPIAIQVRADGRKAFLFGSAPGDIQIIDLQSLTSSFIKGPNQTAWWRGNDIARITPCSDPYENYPTLNQRIVVGSKSLELPSDYQFVSADPTGSVMVAKTSKDPFEGPISVFRILPDSLAIDQIRMYPGKYQMEYLDPYAITWSGTSGNAAISITDPNDVKSLPLFSTFSDIKKAATGRPCVTLSYPKWIGDEWVVLVGESDPSTGNTNPVVRYYSPEGKLERTNPIPLPDAISSGEIEPNGRRIACVGTHSVFIYNLTR